ncbi:hypothetical protein F5146DRAFT_1122507 [Armillaria mellea]|nr:hypothetical protein F5146DRAFT_1122507 [Armillaria mellea]
MPFEPPLNQILLKANRPYIDKRFWMLLYFVVFGFCFATSIGLKFDDITANATVGVPFTLTWHLDQGEDPYKVQFEQRLTSQNTGNGTALSFSFPSFRDGTVPITFLAPGEHIVEAFTDDSASPIGSSNKITVSSLISGSNSGSTPAATSATELIPNTPTATSPVVPIFSASSSYSNGDPSTISSFEITSTIGGISTTTFTPASPPNNPISHKTKQKWTIVGAVLGVVLFLLLLALGIVYYYRLCRSRRHMLLPCSTVMRQYLQIRHSSQCGAIHKLRLRGRDVPSPASVDRLRPTSTASRILEFDVEEGVPRANLPRKSTELGATRSLPDGNTLGPDPSLSEGLPEPESHQIQAEEPTRHPNTLDLPLSGRNDEMAEEIIRLRTQIQQLIVDRVSGRDQDREMDPPPAYVRDG